jgi:hypothetical protein
VPISIAAEMLAQGGRVERAVAVTAWLLATAIPPTP